MFLLTFLQRPLCQYSRSRRKEPNVREFVRVWADGGGQLKLLGVDSDYCLVKRDVIRTCTVGWL